MTAFIRRFREMPTLEQLTEIEQIAVVDNTPSTPTTGVGQGALMLVGEFEDGPFNQPVEVFGSDDEQRQFGGFGFTYGDLLYQNPAARIRAGEHWNGNAFIKGKFLRPPRKVCVRVDTSVGSVRLSPRAARLGDQGPFRMEVGDQLSIAYNGGSAATTTAIAAAAALRAGSGFDGTSGYGGGEQIGITTDGGTEVVVTFQAADSNAAQLVARINSFLGYTGAAVNSGEVDISGIIQGTAGSVALRDITAGALAAIGHTAGSTSGTGNVANLSAVTAAEIVALGAGGTGGAASVVDSRPVYSSTTAVTGTVNIAASAMATRLGLTTGLSAAANIGAATRIPAGTRCRYSAAEWVTMQSITVPEGTSAAPTPAFYDVKIRPGLDDSTALGATAAQISTLVDQPAGDRIWVVTNPSNVSAALTEDQLDVRYETAFDATVEVSTIAREVNEVLSARMSQAIRAKGRENMRSASDNGCRGRRFYPRPALGTMPAAAITNVALTRSDRMFYCYPGWQIRVPEIATLGVAGGTGFTEDGVITIGSDGPLAFINSVINPEENPGQDTQLLEFVIGIEPIPQVFNRELYVAFKRAGICAPRVDQRGIPVYQSEVTSDLTPGRTTQKRRKMADYIQDSLAILSLPYSKKLASDAREGALDAVYDSFLGGLRSIDNPASQRIEAYTVANTTAKNPELKRRGITARKVRVVQLNSMDTIVIDTEIGEGVVIITES